jgi:triacylglycerol lipase
MVPALTPVSAFSVENAIYFAVASSLAYNSSDATFATQLNDQMGFAGVNSPCASGANCAYVIEDDKALTLAFRGTWDFNTAESDAAVALVSDPLCAGATILVHQGFKTALDSLWGAVTALIRDSRTRSAAKPLFVTGHSLGGALATLASARLLRMGIGPTAVYTYGSPRVGNVGFFDAYQCVNYRVVNRMDIVPHVPLQDILTQLNPPSVLLPFLRSVDFLGKVTYKHVGTLELITAANELVHDDESWGDEKEYVATVIGAMLPLMGGNLSWDWIAKNKPQTVSDHSIVNYIANLTSLLG